MSEEGDADCALEMRNGVKQLKASIVIMIKKIDDEIKNDDNKPHLAQLKTLHLGYKRIFNSIEDVEKTHLYKSTNPPKSIFLSGTNIDPYVVSLETGSPGHPYRKSTNTL